MESYKTCPICLQIPEQEIYQCTNGHTVCNICIEKLQTCPQCRIPFGEIKIRTRALEEILNEHKYDCKFKAHGCSTRCNRNEISKHGNVCSRNPDYIPLCNKVGFKNCSFSIGCKTREEIIEHFKKAHGALFETVANCVICLKDFYSVQASNKPTTCRPVIQSCGNTNKSPLFLILAKVNSPLGYISWSCVHIWGTENVQNCVEFSTHGDVSSEILPMSWKVGILSAKDSEAVLNGGLISASIPLILKQYLHSNKDLAFKVILRTAHSMDFGIKNKKETWVFTKPIENESDSILVESRPRRKLFLTKRQEATTASAQIQILSPTVGTSNVAQRHPPLRSAIDTSMSTSQYQCPARVNAPPFQYPAAFVSQAITPSPAPLHRDSGRSNSIRVSNQPEDYPFQNISALPSGPS